MKRCTNCRSIKSFNLFSKDKQKSDGLTSWCKKCLSNKRKNYYKNNKSKVNKSFKEYYKKAKKIIIEKADFRHFIKNFGGQREKVFKKYNHKCADCGKTNIESILLHKKSLLIHHIDGKGSNMPKDLKNNKIDNLILLCIPCHRKRHKKYEDL